MSRLTITACRAVISQNGVLEEVNGYYPYGGLLGAPAAGVQARKYGGKEFDRENGLDWLDSQARMYDFIIGRTPTMDPMSEKYYHLSPYLWCAGNPLRFIDLTGKEYGDFFSTMNAAARDFGKIYNAISIKLDKEYGSEIYVIRNKKGQIGYTYMKPNQGTAHGVDCSKAPPGTDEVADIHTHGAYSEDYYDNRFSGAKPTPEENKNSDYGDILNSNESGKIGYLAIPNGSLQKYYPKTGVIKTISILLPSDEKDPERLNMINPK